jgi:hypothetical protein
MATCCDTSTGFPTAPEMKNRSQNLALIYREICAIQQAILEASSGCGPGGGQYCTTIAGQSPMTNVNGILAVEIIDGGSGYVDIKPFTVAYDPLGNQGDSVLSTVTNGSAIVSVPVVSAGSTNYAPIAATARIYSLSGFENSISPLVNENTGRIYGAVIHNPGFGYSPNDGITIEHPIGQFASLIPTFDINGSLISVKLANPGIRYNTLFSSVDVMSSADNSLPYPTGAGFNGYVKTDDAGLMKSVDVINGGVSYVNLGPVATVVDPEGTGAHIDVVQTNGVITSATITANGYNYTKDATVTVDNPETALPPTTPAILEVKMFPAVFPVDSEHYWQVASGAVKDAIVQDQIDAVMTYFTKLGYTITPIANPENGSTLAWTVCWA